MNMNHSEYWTPTQDRRAEMVKEIERLNSVKESLAKIIDFCPMCELNTVCENHLTVRDQISEISKKILDLQKNLPISDQEIAEVLAENKDWMEKASRE